MYPQNNKKSFITDYNGEIVISKALDKKRNQTRKMSAYYSFLTIVLFFCLIQISCSALLNISKVISYRQKIHVMKNTKNQVLQKNKQLKVELNNISTASRWEEIARNNLKMAADKEILIIFNDENINDTQLNGNEKNGKHN